jgi:toxin ParE1/3/4
MKQYEVKLTEEAELDLLDVYNYMARNYSAEKAFSVLEHLEKACLSLAELLLRGHTPLELERIGVFTYREIYHKPYRIIYQIIDREVYIHCVINDRRDMQSLLQQRLYR